MLEIVLGGSGAGKTHKVYEKIIKDSIKNHSTNYYLIVPDQFTLETQRDIVERYPNGGTMNIDIVSFSRLAYRVFGELGVNKLSVLDDTGKMLVLRRVVEQNKDDLTIFREKAKKFGFVENVKSTISELYQYGINVEDIEEICEKIPANSTVKSKLNDIKLIYDKFAEYVESISSPQAKYITKEELLNELCNVIDESELVKDSVVVLDGFTGFTPIQYRVIEHLLKMAQKVVVTVTLDKKETEKCEKDGFSIVKEHELFNLSKNTVNTLVKLAAKNDIDINIDKICDYENVIRLRDNNELAHLEKNLFRNSEKMQADGKSLFIYNAVNPIDEASGIADLIHNMVAESKGNLRYRDFAIVTGDMELYKRPLEEALSANKIPYFIDNKKSLLNNNFVECIRALLEMVDENFKYEPVFRYLKRGMSDLSREDIDIFENYVIGCGIKGQKQYKEPFRKKYRGLTDEEFNRCESIRIRFIEPILVFKENIKDKNVSDITKAIYKFIKDNDLYNKLKGYIDIFSDEDSEKQEYTQSYKLIMELFDKMVGLFGDEVISLKEYRKILDDGFEEIKVGTIPVLLDQMVVGDIERTRMNNIKVLCVLGVNDDIIPKTGGNMGVLSQRDRNVLKNISVEMSPTIKENSFIQKFYLYLNLTKPSEKLILTYSDSSLDGNAKRPSYLINTLLKMFDGIKVESMSKIYDDAGVLKVVSREAAFKIVTKGLRDKEMGNVWKELFSYYSMKPEYSKKISRALEGAFYRNLDVKLESAVAKAIYGNNVEGSITRLEKYAKCAYMHFLMYGLNLVERPVYEIKEFDIGNIYHKAVEVFSEQIKSSDFDFKNVSDEEREKLVDLSVTEAINYYGMESLNESAKNQYILDKIRRVTSKSAWAICEHIKRGEFNPEQFEVSTGKGRIDRIDLMESGDCLYVKIIDYKSGNDAFDTNDLINGLQMQLVYYMGTALEYEKRLNPDKTVTPAGLFYFNIKDPVIAYEESLLEEDNISKATLKHFQMTGIYNSASEVLLNIDKEIPNLVRNSSSDIVKASKSDVDVEDKVKIASMGLSSANIEKVIEYVNDKAKTFTKEIYDGVIDINPYNKGQNASSCSYCSYNTICSFSKQEFGNNYRKLKKYDKDGEKYGMD